MLTAAEICDSVPDFNVCLFSVNPKRKKVFYSGGDLHMFFRSDDGISVRWFDAMENVSTVQNLIASKMEAP